MKSKKQKNKSFEHIKNKSFEDIKEYSIIQQESSESDSDTENVDDIINKIINRTKYLEKIVSDEEQD